MNIFTVIKVIDVPSIVKGSKFNMFSVMCAAFELALSTQFRLGELQFIIGQGNVLFWLL